MRANRRSSTELCLWIVGMFCWMEEGSGLAAVEQTDILVNHRFNMSHCCHTVVKKAHIIGGHVRSCVLPKASEAFPLLPVLVNPSLVLFPFWMLRFEEYVGQ